MSEFSDALDVLSKVYPSTLDGEAHLHTVILEGIAKFGLGQCLTPSFVIYLAKTAHMPLPVAEDPAQRPTLKIIEGGRQ